MTIIKAGILTLSGITFASSDIATLDPTSTKVVAMPIPIPLSEDVVVARVGQVPRTRTRIGFSFRIPFVKF
jgi:hypothetical protein